MSRIAAGEAEILSVAVSASYRGKGWRGGCSICHMGRLLGVGSRVIFLEVDEGIPPPAGSTGAPASRRPAAAKATTPRPTASGRPHWCCAAT
jgi:hypothetical protein